MGFLGFLKKDKAASVTPTKQQTPPRDLQFKQENDTFNSVPTPPEPFQNDPFGAPEQETPDFGGPARGQAIPENHSQAQYNHLQTPDNRPQTQSYPGPDLPAQTLAQPEPQTEQPPDPFADQSLDQPAVTDTQEAADPFAEETGGFALPDLPEMPESAQPTLDETVSTADEVDDHADYLPPGELPEALPEKEEPKKEQEKQGALLPEAAPEADIDYPKAHVTHEPTPKNIFIDSHTFFDTLQQIKGLKKQLRDTDTIVRKWADVDNKLEATTGKLIEAVDDMQEKLIAIDTELFER